ncbi:MAG: 6-pyruvoyl tetrahydropterin synthase family protein [Flavobacteriales bacterium]
MKERIVYVTRRERFNAAHKLWNDEWDLDKNLKVFGKCANPNWHGHNYELHITVKGKINADTGYLIDLKDLSRLVNERVIDKLDHKNLNLDVDFLRNQMTSTEILTFKIWDELEDEIKKIGAELHKVHLYETENNSAEYYGE